MPNASSIRARMDDIGITQKAAAAALNIAQSTLSLKINGVRPFYLDEAWAFAQVLQIAPEQFSAYFF